MLLKTLLEDLDLDNPPSNYDEQDTRDMAAGIFKIAERRAYDAAADQGGNITHNQIMQAAMQVLKELQIEVDDLIQQDFQNQG